MRFKLFTYRFCLMISIALVAFSCQRDIDVELPGYTEKVVVDAHIETGQKAVVYLSLTAPYFEAIDLTNPSKYFIKGAFVTVTDGIDTDTLQELPNIGYLYNGTKIIGQVGRNYYLTVRYRGKTYSAQTYIHPPVPLDSLFFKGEKDSLGFIWAHLTEPSTPGNCYRFLAKRLHHDQDFVAPFNSAFDDQFINGESFDFAFERGRAPSTPQNNGDDPDAGYYEVGDTVVSKFCSIGHNEYLFWRSYYNNLSSNGNPFSAPNNLQNTVIGDNVIGCFCGYGTSFDTLILKKN